MPDDDHLSVSVAVLTYRRPDAVAALVPLLLDEAQGLLASALPVGRAEVLVVDNDPPGTARRQVEDAERGWRSLRGADAVRMRYVVEHRSGVAAGRNRALREADGQTLLAFLDDDELPRPGWLCALVGAALEHHADAVAGTVVTEFPAGTDPWITESGFLAREHRARLPSGTPIGSAATNNLLLDLRTTRRLGLRFDDAFGETGAEDTLFTRSLVAAGGRLVWCADAVVDDHLSPDRLTRSWMLHRTFGHGTSEPRVAVALSGGGASRLATRGRELAAGLARSGLGSCWLLGGWLRGDRARAARGLRMLVRGAGNTLGVFGYRHRAYGARRARSPR